MINTIHSLNIILPFFYAVTFGVYVYAFFKDDNGWSNGKRILLFITLLTHIVYILQRTIEFDHPPITSKFEIFTVLAFSIACCYFVIELLTDVKETGLFILIFALVFQAVSTCCIQDLFEVKEVLRNRLLGLHVISALLGYAAFIISAVYGVLFFILYKDIKLNKFSIIFEKLPSLETLEKLSFTSVFIGFLLLTIATVIGFGWLPSAFPDFDYLDPKIISTSVVWLIYASGIVIKFVGKWYGKKVIMFSITGFIFAMFSLLFANIIANSFHTFY